MLCIYLFYSLTAKILFFFFTCTLMIKKMCVHIYCIESEGENAT